MHDHYKLLLVNTDANVALSMIGRCEVAVWLIVCCFSLNFLFDFKKSIFFCLWASIFSNFLTDLCKRFLCNVLIYKSLFSNNQMHE